MLNNRRKKNLVHRAIQLALVKRMLLQWFFFVLVTCALTVATQFIFDPLQTRTDWNYHFRVTVSSFLLVSLCMIPIFLRDSIKLSNRFVGPIMRLQTFVQKVGRDDVDKLQFRQGDFWTTLSQDFNDMLDRLRGREDVQPDAGEVQQELETAGTE